MLAIHIDSLLQPDEVRQRLGRVVGPPVRNDSATAALRPLVGRLGSGSFTVRRRIARRPLWQSTLDGHYSAVDRGTRIDLQLPAAAPLIVLLAAITGIVLRGEPAVLALLAAMALMASATIAYDALRVVAIIRNAVRGGEPPAPRPQPVPAPPSHSERKIA